MKDRWLSKSAKGSHSPTDEFLFAADVQIPTTGFKYQDPNLAVLRQISNESSTASDVNLNDLVKAYKRNNSNNTMTNR